VRKLPRNRLRALLYGASDAWRVIGVLRNDQLRAAAPAVVATLERAARIAFGAHPPPTGRGRADRTFEGMHRFADATCRVARCRRNR